MKKSKATRKLLAAAISLGLAVASTVGSTFAWFSMNSTVSATGMNVTVSAPTSLLISKTNATEGFGATVALDSNLAADAVITASSYADYATTWYKLTDKAMKKVNENGRIADFSEVADGSTAASFTNAKIGTDNVYVATTADYFYDEIWLKLEGDETPDAKFVSVSAAYSTQTDAAIKNAMHIIFVVGNAVVGTIDMGDAEPKASDIVELTPNASEGTLVKVYYFLSGNDTDCKNVNIKADTELSVDLTFSIPQD